MTGIADTIARLFGAHQQPRDGELLAPGDAQAPSPETRAEFVAAIKLKLQGAVEQVVAAGDLLVAAKAKLDHGEFGDMIEADLPFGGRTARRLMAIAEDPWIRDQISNRTHESVLPASWMTLYEITRLPPERRDELVAGGVINPTMQRRDIATVAKQEHRDRREAELGDKIRALPDQRFGVILADPEWRFEPWSARGLDRGAENHYPTSVTDVIAARDVPSIAADDCVLYLWARADMLPQAIAVIEAWGFDFKSSSVWDKETAGTGYWFRMRHELVLVGTRGKPVAPAPGSQDESVTRAPRGPHSAKPDYLAEMIERLWPHVPKIELNRRGPRRPGWQAWGNEAEAADAGAG